MMMIAPVAIVQMEQDPEAACLEASPDRDADPATQKARQKSWRAAEFQIGTFGATMIARPNDAYLPDGLPADFRDAMTGVVFTLGVDGRSHDCGIGRSAGIDALDRAACRMISEHVISAPAVRDGVSVAKTVKLAVRWHRSNPTPAQQACASEGNAIPITSPNTLPFWAFEGFAANRGKSVRIKLDLSSTGVPQRCAILAATADAPMQRRTCMLAVQTLRYLPPTDNEGRLVASTMRLNIRFN